MEPVSARAWSELLHAEVGTLLRLAGVPCLHIKGPTVATWLSVGTFRPVNGLRGNLSECVADRRVPLRRPRDDDARRPRAAVGCRGGRDHREARRA